MTMQEEDKKSITGTQPVPNTSGQQDLERTASDDKGLKLPPKEVFFDDAVRLISEVVDRLWASGNQFVTVAVYGDPNSGKSRLIDQIGKCLGEAGTFFASGGAVAEESFANSVETSRYIRGPSVYFFHWGTARLTGSELAHSLLRDPDHVVRTVQGKYVDISVGIYNPRFASIPDLDVRSCGLYDFLVYNPHSYPKALTGQTYA